MTTITDVAVFDGHDLLPGRHDVRIDGDRIAAVSPSGATGTPTESIDGRGATLLPGLIDGHVHLSQPSDFASLLRGGVTSAADMATWPPEHLEELRAQAGRFDFRTPGAPLIGPAGPHSHMPGLDRAVIDSPEAARREVASRVDQGVDYIKLVLEAPGRGGPEPDAARAAVEAAHAAGLRVVAHASSVGAIDLAVEIRVDILTHAPIDGDVTDGVVARIVANQVTVVPTLIMMRTTAERRSILPAYAHAKRFVTDLHAAGATLVVGSDANSAPGAPAAVPHATGALDELELLVDAGLSPLEALRAATSTAAALFRWENRGIVRADARADLVLVDGDPTADIRATRSARGMWLAGHKV
jgi:imidazolonepropionase-like amidohydrolase